MFFTLKEIVRWLWMTAFELFLHLLALLVFTILLVIKVECPACSTGTWWGVFSPLFICDGLNAYFCVIVFIRMNGEREYRRAGLRFLAAMFCISMLFTSKILICQKLTDRKQLSNSEVMIPMFLMLQIIMVRACQQVH